MKRLAEFVVSTTLMRWLRLAACAGLVWLRVYPADWTPYAVYALRGVCLAYLAVSLTRYAAVLRLANRPWWRFCWPRQSSRSLCSPSGAPVISGESEND